MVNFLDVSTVFVRAFTLFNVNKYPFVSYQSQNYFSIVVYLLLALAICSLLVTLAYLFSLSSVQDSEKRSEYECGFEPFDSATRLPFDVHFYLVGILFLIFDVEIALLFPWVLGLHSAGWFSFYIMLGFVFLLGIGFLYEWKRGALIWPSRQTEAPYTPQSRPSDVYTAGAPSKMSALPYLVAASRYGKINETYGQDANVVAARKLARFSKVLSALRSLRLAFRVRRIHRIFSSLKLVTLTHFVNAISIAETQLKKYRKTVYFFLKRSSALAASCRAANPHTEVAISRKEKELYSALLPVAREYLSFHWNYKGLSRKFKKSELFLKAKRLPKPLFLRVQAVRRYLAIQALYYNRRNWRLKHEKRHLRRQINPQSNFRFSNQHYSKNSNNSFGQRPFRRNFTFFSFSAFAISDSFTTQLLTSFLPEVILISSILLVLTYLALELGEGRSKKELALTSFSALVLALNVVIIAYAFQFTFGEFASVFNDYAAVSPYITLIKLLTAVTGRFILVESRKFLVEHPRHLLEYPVVLTLAILFMLLLVGSTHLVSAFFALVGFSLNLYVLVLFDGSTAVAREAGVKYFYLSTFSAGLILFGIFLLFAVTGTGHFYEIQHCIFPVAECNSAALQLAIAFLLVGLFFKLSAFPGHLWAADVYEGSPDPITAFFMLPVKVAVLGFTVHFLSTALASVSAYWQPIVAFAALASLVWGCVAALAEKNTKRFLAYASVNQIGFLLLGLSTGSIEGYRATLFYLVLYAIMNTGFLIVFLNARRADGTSLIYLTDFRGFGQRYGTYSWSIAIILLSMAGIPPLAGFYGKYYLLLHAQEQGLTLLVIAGLATSLISTYYYLRLIKIFWFEGSEHMTTVNCDLSPRQSRLLIAVECILWVTFFFTAAVMLHLDEIVLSMLAPEGFFLQAYYEKLRIS